MIRRHLHLVLLTCGLWLPVARAAEPQAATAQQEQAAPIDLVRGLAAHWPFAGDTQDHSRNALQVRNQNVELGLSGPHGKARSAAGFNGRDAFVEVTAHPAPPQGKGDFSLAAWVHTESTRDAVPGDLLSRYDPIRRRGFHLTLKTNAGVTLTQANRRQLQFGIDSKRESSWEDCGRPGKALLAFALAVHGGQLYAGTCEPGKGESGRVYRYGGGQQWIDCGAPDRSNAVTAFAAFEGKLYAGTGKYRVAGSALPESENVTLGGRIFRHDGGAHWTDCGQLPGTEAVGGMVVFGGRLYASSLYRAAGFFRYEGGTTWTDSGTPNGKRVGALTVYRERLYASSYDGGDVYRYDGKNWAHLGRLGDNTQTYSFAIHEGRLHVGTWPSGRVYRLDDNDRWIDLGRLGEELEVMGMVVHNGRLLAGTLPSAEVYSYEGGTQWQRLACLDATPNVKYRRAWTMAEYQGRLFCSTLPSGRVFAFEAGKSATWDQEFPPGWHHVAAVKRGGRLELHVDGRLVGQSSEFDPAAYDLTSESALRIGMGANDYFHGRLSDVRVYGRALSAAEVAELARRPR